MLNINYMYVNMGVLHIMENTEREREQDIVESLKQDIYTTS